MLNKTIAFMGACLLVLGAAGVSSAKSTPTEIEQLGKNLTPMGAEMAGNKDGTIPAWTGGITTPPAGYKPRDNHPDPYADDKVLFTISASNMDQYADKLTEGHKAMLGAYDTFNMNVYPSRRSASAPQRIYDATRKVAATAELIGSGNGVTGAVIGIPFPIPKNGLEVFWNHILRWRGNAMVRTDVKGALTRQGRYVLTKKIEEMNFQYAQAGMTEEKLNNVILQFKNLALSPAAVAGEMTLVHETLNQEKEHRKAWKYSPGQRRVRRAPNLAFDNPDGSVDGLAVTDQKDMINGSPERYTWNLVGKKEIYVPYNAYKLNSDTLKYKDILTPRHPAPEHLRYELHRVWVVDAILKQGTRHVYKRRTLYVDDDSWQILAVDLYDNRDDLWRFSEGHGINYYEVPTFWTCGEFHYDLQSGRYAISLLNSRGTARIFSEKIDTKEFTPNALRRSGRR